MKLQENSKLYFHPDLLATYQGHLPNHTVSIWVENSTSPKTECQSSLPLLPPNPPLPRLPSFIVQFPRLTTAQVFLTQESRAGEGAAVRPATKSCHCLRCCLLSLGCHPGLDMITSHLDDCSNLLDGLPLPSPPLPRSITLTHHQQVHLPRMLIFIDCCLPHSNSSNILK